MYSLKRKILGNPLNAKVLSLAKEGYLVGGYIRDILIRGTHSKDLDYVVGEDIRRLANTVARALGGKVVEMRKERMLRVCLKEATLDFSKVERCIEDDLRNRDFTFNAMAWSPGTGLIDPLKGVNDIKKGIVRGISRENFKNDPVRLLRAYRFSAELSFQIHKNTRQVIRTMPEKIRLSAPERITLEFFKLLNSKKPSKALGMALEDGVLSCIISLSFNNLKRNIKLVSKINGILDKLPEKYILKEFSQGLKYIGLLRLEALLLDSEANLLTLSRDTYKRVSIVKRLYDDFKVLEVQKRRAAEVFNLFKDSGDALLDLLILSGNTGYLKDAERFFRIQKRGILSSEEIISITGLTTGVRLGRIIQEVKRLQFEGVIRTKAAAREFLRLQYQGERAY